MNNWTSWTQLQTVFKKYQKVLLSQPAWFVACSYASWWTTVSKTFVIPHSREYEHWGYVMPQRIDSTAESHKLPPLCTCYLFDSLLSDNLTRVLHRRQASLTHIPSALWLNTKARVQIFQIIIEQININVIEADHTTEWCGIRCSHGQEVSFHEARKPISCWCTNFPVFWDWFAKVSSKLRRQLTCLFCR